MAKKDEGTQLMVSVEYVMSIYYIAAIGRKALKAKLEEHAIRVPIQEKGK